MPKLKTEICERLEIEYPVFQAGMGFVARGTLAGAVSEAGGLGVIGAGSNMTRDELKAEIDAVRDVTSKPFGVDILFATVRAEGDVAAKYTEAVQQMVDVVIEEKVPVLISGLGSPKDAVPAAHAAGMYVMSVCGAVRHAEKAAADGVDAVIASGVDGGGHVGRIGTAILIPAVVDAVDVPVLAGGGLADGRGLAAALAFGAQGVWMGTRFIATKEAPVHENVKQAILNASELDTRLVMRPLRNTERVLTNPAVERLLEKEKAMGSDLKFEDIVGEVAGVYPKVMTEGDMDVGAWSCGMVAGLVYDIPTVQELMDRIMSEADALITERLAHFSAA